MQLCDAHNAGMFTNLWGEAVSCLTCKTDKQLSTSDLHDGMELIMATLVSKSQVSLSCEASKLNV